MRTTSKTFHNGSSPLTRGTQNKGLGPIVHRRFIPAYAGNSPVSAENNPQLSVHPRLRGELNDCWHRDTNSRGSSPLTRGTLRNATRSIVISRFIPAYAGNSLWIMCLWTRSSVHPRLRGELGIRVMGAVPISWFIPAYAGNSLKQGIEHLTNSSKDFLSGKYAKNPETVLNHFKNSSLD